MRLFADDAILTLSDKDEKNLQHIMNDQLTKIDDWMKINQLTTNYKKAEKRKFPLLYPYELAKI